VSASETITPTEVSVGGAVDRHRIHTLPVLVLFPHNRCNCRCVMCDIWRIRETREITAADLAPHVDSFRALGVRWVVFSGGEPQMHADLASLSRLLRAEGIRVTLLTAGLLLEPQARLVADNIDDVIVSLDGPREVHDRIRRIPSAFDRLACGVEELRRLRPEIVVRGRSTVQKANHNRIRETVRAAKEIGLNSISFLAVDVSSEAFNRPQGWTVETQSGVALDSNEVHGLEEEVEALIEEYADEIAAGYIIEGAEKLRRIVGHFRAHLGEVYPIAPRCNAPWVSAVIEADGTVRPCFFHRAIGNIHAAMLPEILNGHDALEFRRELDVATNAVCQRCVCSLYLSPENVLQLA
jgi:Fe-coproporphyrin III synthase